MTTHGDSTQHGKPERWGRDTQPDAREGQAGPPRVADRSVVPTTPGNSSRGKRPEFKVDVRRGVRAGRLATSLIPPPKVRKVQEALHAKAKRSPDYRFYALYDKVYRKDILEFAHSARGELLRRAVKTLDALTAFQHALELARQEPEKRFLAARFKGLTGRA